MANSSRQLKDIAKALVDVADEAKALPEVLMSLHAVRDAFASDRRLIVTLSDHAVSIAHRRNALHAALKGHAHELAVNALLVLQDASLLDELPAFTSDVVSAAKERAEHRRAEVISAIELKADERHALEKTLIKKFGGSVELVLKTDPKLIGGLIVSVDGWLFDGSTLGNCKRLAGMLATP